MHSHLNIWCLCLTVLYLYTKLECSKEKSQNTCVTITMTLSSPKTMTIFVLCATKLDDELNRVHNLSARVDETHTTNKIDIQQYITQLLKILTVWVSVKFWVAMETKFQDVHVPDVSEVTPGYVIQTQVQCPKCNKLTQAIQIGNL